MMIAMTVPPITRTIKTTATATIIKVDPDPVSSLGVVSGRGLKTTNCTTKMSELLCRKQLLFPLMLVVHRISFN